MKRSQLFGCIAVALAIGLTAVTAARFVGPSAYDLSWHTIDSGGETFSTGGGPSGFQLGGTIGQPDAGALMTGGGPTGFELVGGFWAGAAGPIIETCPADIAPTGAPDGLVNIDDLLAVINMWGNCADPNNCPADIAPLGGNDLINVDDLLAVIGGWGACP
jgi:hypothetical protein